MLGITSRIKLREGNYKVQDIIVEEEKEYSGNQSNMEISDRDIGKIRITEESDSHSSVSNSQEPVLSQETENYAISMEKLNIISSDNNAMQKTKVKNKK